MQPDMDPIEPARVEWQGATPISSAFGDSYYATAAPSAEGPSINSGADERRLVFLNGNRLEARFERLRAGDAFVIGETGFGTGLGLLMAASLFLKRAPAGARLHLVSAEKHPLRLADLQRALTAWPALGDLARRLIEQWPPAVCGFHRIWLDEAIDLTLMYGDATAMWCAQQVDVDAWFLDGFAPARNETMWTPALFERIAALSRPGATLATFSAAGSVRRGLADAGFETHRCPGFGHKRHRLEARAPGSWRPRPARTGHAIVVGAGLAGCTTARALTGRGWSCQLIDAGDVAGRASGNRVGVVYTTPSGKATPQNRFYQSSWIHALRWLRRLDAEKRGLGTFNGVEQIFADPRRRKKLRGALDSGHWPRELLEPLGDDGVLLVGAGVVRPAAWCRLLIEDPAIEPMTGRRVERLIEGSGLQLDDGQRLDADAIVLCTAGAINELVDGPALPIRTIRGQVSEVASTDASRAWSRAICHAGYFSPPVDGIHCVGASFDLHDDEPHPRAADDVENLQTLRRWCPEAWSALGGDAAHVVGHRVGFRCTSRDYLPLVGTLDATRPVWVDVAFGSRGISSTPLAADRIADALSGAPAPMDRSMIEALMPTRFRPPAH